MEDGVKLGKRKEHRNWNDKMTYETVEKEVKIEN